MAISPLTQPEQIEWKDLPVTLRPPEELKISLIKRVWTVFMSIILFIPRLIGSGIASFAKRIIYPIANPTEDERRASIQDGLNKLNLIKPIININYSTEHSRVRTPDGSELDIVCFRLKNNPGAPTTICFGGNGQPKAISAAAWHLDFAQANLVIFSHRSVDGSSGEFKTTQDLLVDGASVVEWVRRRLNTPNDQIHFHGYSLGGAIALKTKAADSRLTGKLLNDRSFASLGHVVKIPFLSSFLKSYNLELNALEDLPHLQGERLFLWHKEDKIIGSTAVMALTAPNQPTLELTDYDHPQVPYRDNAHCRPLICTEQSQAVANFFYSKAQAQAI